MLTPLAEKYDDYTPYQFSSNQPIHAKELEGLESSNDLNKRVAPQQRAISDKRVQAYAAAAQKSFSNVFNGNLSVKPKFGGLGGDVGVTIGPLKGHVGGAVAKIEGSLNSQKPSVKVKAEGSVEGSLGIKNAKIEGSAAAVSMEGEGSIKNGKPSGEFNAEGGKTELKVVMFQKCWFPLSIIINKGINTKFPTSKCRQKPALVIFNGRNTTSCN